MRGSELQPRFAQTAWELVSRDASENRRLFEPFIGAVGVDKYIRILDSLPENKRIEFIRAMSARYADPEANWLHGKRGQNHPLVETFLSPEFAPPNDAAIARRYGNSLSTRDLAGRLDESLGHQVLINETDVERESSTKLLITSTLRGHLLRTWVESGGKSRSVSFRIDWLGEDGCPLIKCDDPACWAGISRASWLQVSADEISTIVAAILCSHRLSQQLIESLMRDPGKSPNA